MVKLEVVSSWKLLNDFISLWICKPIEEHPDLVLQFIEEERKDIRFGKS